MDALGQRTAFEYDAVGNRTKMIAPNGAVTEYRYNNVDRLEQIIDPEGFISKFTYDGNGNLIRGEDPRNGIMEIKYDARNLPVEIKDAQGAVTSFAYDAIGRMIRETNALGHVTAYEYDAIGRLLKVTDALGQVTAYGYDPTGRLTSVTKPSGAVWQMQYDSRGLLTGTVDPLGNVTSMQRDALGRVTVSKDETGAATTYNYDPLGRVTSIINALGHATNVAYDPLGRVKQITDSKGQMTAYGYDALGRLLEVTNALGNKTRYAYDAVGNIVGKTDALGRVTSYRYDLRGLLTQQTNPLGEMTRLLYDGNGNTTGIQYPDGNTVAYEYDPMNRLTQILYHDGKKVQYAYDAIGRRTSMTDALGTTTYAYDALNRLTEVTDTANRTIRYEWTPTGQRSKVTYPDGGVVSYQYDLMDRMTQVTDPRGLTTSYDYDARGLMVSKQLPMQGGSTYSYDGLGQLLELKHTDRFGKVVEQLTYAYDPVGNRIRMERAKDYHDDDYDHDDNDYGHHDDGYDHDEDNEKEHYDHDDKDRYNEDDDHPKRVVTEYAYDALNQLTQVQKYNASAPAVPAITSYSYDAVGNRLSKSSTWGMKTNREDYTYNPADQLIHWQSGKGYKDYTYDLRGNLLNVTGTIYDHDEADDKGMVTKDVYGASVSNHEYENNVSWNVYGAYARDHDDDEYHRIDEQYSWDAANRLVQQINTKGKMTRFSYDGDGNRVSMALGKRHDDDDHHDNDHHDNDHRGHEDKSYRYDDVEDEHWKSLRFTNDVSLALPEVIQVRSDVREDDPWQTSFVYGAGQERLSMTYFDNEDRDHKYGDDDKHPRTMYYLQDALGSVIGLMNSKGHVTARNSYDEFGIATKRDHDDDGPKYGNLYGYTGLEYDDSTGLNYARARYYKPEIGRFISEDTYKGTLGNPQSQNGYAYVWNNPLIYTDPSGYKVWLIHGTWSDGDTWTPDFVDYVEGLFDETSEKLDWSGGNTNGARTKAAEYFAQKIYDYQTANPNEPIRLVGHSHGGNVAIMITNILAKKGLRVPNLITIATPVRGYQLETDVGQHIQVYNDYDAVQINGGSIWAGGNAQREFPDAENVNVSDEISFWWGVTNPIDSHSYMHSNINIWNKYIEPILRK